MRRILDWLRGGRAYSDVRPPIRPGDDSPFTAGTAFLDAEPWLPPASPAEAAPPGDPPLCAFADVAVVSAALTGPRSRRFRRCVGVFEGAFAGADAPREIRLRALMALRTRVAASRRAGAAPADAPAWARGRLPAARRPLTRAPTALSPDLAAVVDAALTPILPAAGPGFGRWDVPSFVQEEVEATVMASRPGPAG